MNAAATTMERHRAWRGPALLSFGFRPFFLLGALWAALAMALWVAMLAGKLTLPTAFDPVSWHAHEFLFGYLGAIIAGFLLTAVPNWTGRLPVTGWPLAGLVAAWLAGRSWSARTGATCRSSACWWYSAAPMRCTIGRQRAALLQRKEWACGLAWPPR